VGQVQPERADRATAGFVISSPLISQRYQQQPDYRAHADRRFPPAASGSEGRRPDRGRPGQARGPDSRQAGVSCRAAADYAGPAEAALMVCRE
jgi:hypothetical protein